MTAFVVVVVDDVSIAVEYLSYYLVDSDWPVMRWTTWNRIVAVSQ